MYSGRDRGVGQSLREAIRQIGNTARAQAAAARVRLPHQPLRTGLILLAMAPASHAVTLGEVAVHSPLGQPLDASVPLSLAADETLTKACIAPVRGTANLTAVPAPRVQMPLAGTAGTFALRVITDTPLYEPMYALALQVNCPGAPALVREYVLMLDLPATAASLQLPVAVTVPADVPADVPATVPTTSPGETGSSESMPPVAAASAPVTARAPAPVRERSRASTATPGKPIVSGTRYRVSAGDTLSSIAARVSDRGMSLWQMADLIFATNPAAFIRNDPDLIRLGSEIVIPAPMDAAPAAGPAAGPAMTGEGAAPAAGPNREIVAAVPASRPAPAATIPAVAAQEPIRPDTDAMVQDLAPDTLHAMDETAPPADADVSVLPAAAPVRADTLTAEPVPAAEPVAVRAVAPPEPQVSPLVAGAAGVLFGFVVSGLLWLRRGFEWRRAAASRPQSREPEERRYPRTNAPLPVSAPAEPAFSVSYTPADEPAATPVSAPVPVDDITAQLEELFDAEGPDGDSGKTVAARILPAEEDAGSFTNRDEPELQVLLPAPEETLQSPTLHTPVDLFRDETASNETLSATSIDLETLMTANDNGSPDSQTLIEALKMLERDYEAEATGSQVIDFDAARNALASDDDATQVRRKKRSG